MPAENSVSGKSKSQGRLPKREPIPNREVQCRLCGAATPVRAACRNCGAPLGLIANPGDPTGGTFLPIGMSYPPPIHAIQAVPDRLVPPALAGRRWNWGACGASLFWLIAHRVWGWALIVLLLDAASLLALFSPLYLLLPFSGVLLSLMLGDQGVSLAWQRHKNTDATAFLHTQTRWKWFGLVVLPLKIALIAALTWAALKHR